VILFRIKPTAMGTVGFYSHSKCMSVQRDFFSVPVLVRYLVALAFNQYRSATKIQYCNTKRHGRWTRHIKLRQALTAALVQKYMHKIHKYKIHIVIFHGDLFPLLRSCCAYARHLLPVDFGGSEFCDWAKLSHILESLSRQSIALVLAGSM